MFVSQVCNWFHEIFHEIDFTKFLECVGPPPEEPAGAVVSFVGDMTDENATYPVGTIAAYTCAMQGLTKYAYCSGSGYWEGEYLDSCDETVPAQPGTLHYRIKVQAIYP